ncbi:MAG TPA: DnaA/Hda family protein, partial [Ramlibacter sp.]|nr:DnaA/Hda family protein [Ramlibacter sp.]
MKQIALDIGVARVPTLAGFCAGPNEATLAHLRVWADSPTRSPVPTYLWGPAGSGKTHLLRAVAEALREQGAAAGWLDPAQHEPPRFDESWAVVLLDDVDRYTAVQQHAAFNWFVN